MVKDIAFNCGMRFAVAMAFGVNCRAGFHLKRVFDKRLTTSGIFDSQITLFDSIIRYVESDFRGLYELEDMEFVSGVGQVRNKSTGAEHVHEFPGATSQDELPKLYAESRKRHDYLCEKARRLLNGNQIIFLFISGKMKQEQIDKIATTIRATYPKLKFRLIPEPADDLEATYTDGRSWHGNYAAWDRHLAKYKPTLSMALKLWLADIKTRMIHSKSAPAAEASQTT